MRYEPSLCPKCRVRPPRRLHSKHGKVPFCHGCYIEARREQNRLSHLKRPPRLGRTLSKAPVPTHFRGVEHDDISAAEIERRFAEALKVEKAKTREPY